MCVFYKLIPIIRPMQVAELTRWNLTQTFLLIQTWCAETAGSNTSMEKYKNSDDTSKNAIVISEKMQVTDSHNMSITCWTKYDHRNS